ncbi:MAG TPA: LysE family translocator [Anaerolineae bacterium]|nr:LysE family translocator [Anaerolineae bacterium]
MDLSVFVRGLALGFAIAAPVGPIGVLVIRRTLTEGRLAGVVSGLGAATADGIYGFIAAFGLTFISVLLISQQAWIRLIGGLFLLYLGVKTLRAPVAERPAAGFDTAQTGFDTAPVGTPTQPTGGGLLGNYASTFVLTLTNPLTILSFAAVFAGLGVGATSGDYFSATVLVLGVFLGSALWWLVLSTAVSLLRSRVSPSGLRWVNRVSGLIILGFGLAALASLAPLFR